MWIHKYDEINKIYYTKIINPNELENHLKNDWLTGRGTKFKDYKKEHIKTKGVFKR